MPYPTKPKGGWQRPCQVVVNKSTAQLREKKATRKFMNKYQETIQNSMAQGPNDPQGPFLYQEDGKTYASLPAGMLQNIQRSPLFNKMKKDCQAEGVELPQTIMAKDPVAHMMTPQEYLQKVAANGQSSDDERTRGKERPDENLNDGVQGYRAPKTQVSHVALQTDTCDTLYVTKNKMTLYTIAIVQNSQALQYDQMHTALQRASLQIILKTPNLQLQHPTNRPTSRYRVITLKIVLQGDHTPQEQLPLPADVNTALLMAYRKATSLMTLGTICLILMTIHTHTQHSAITYTTPLAKQPTKRL